jgi:hypothetical protein
MTKLIFLFFILPCFAASQYQFPPYVYRGQIEASGQTQAFTISPGAKAPPWINVQVERRSGPVSLPSMKICPNPCSSNLSINVDNLQGLATIVIFDVAGRRVNKTTLNKQQKAHLVDFPASGFYFARLYVDGKSIQTNRFLVMR